MGWNDLIKIHDSILYNDIPDNALFYYVHSFHIVCHDRNIVVGECEYGHKFVSAINKDNIYATQFHPEKSQQHGLKMLNNFLTKA